MDPEREKCDICLGTTRTLKGDQCVCKDGTLSGLARALRMQLLSQSTDADSLNDKIRLRDALLKDIYYWIAKMGFDGTGLQFKKKIRNMLGLD